LGLLTAVLNGEICVSNWSIGVDIIEIEKFQRYNMEEHQRFYEKVFSKYETDYCQSYKDPHPHFAGIFAAKEAVYKAINEFVKIELYHIFIAHDKKTKKPIVEIDYKDKNTKKVDEIKQQLERLEIKVSISHSEKTAIAWAFAVYKDQAVNVEEIIDDIEEKVKEVIQSEFPEKNSS
jgi:holo-[acyl-carrier protein] synthase